MVALPDLAHEARHGATSDDRTRVLGAAPVRESGPRRAVRIFAGSTLVLAALGTWIMPQGAQDAAMMLIRLGFSSTMLLSGVMLLLPPRGPVDAPEIHFDPVTRQVRIVQPDTEAGQTRIAVHALDDLEEVTLRDGVLRARDASGRIVLALHVADAATERAMRQALRLHA